MVRVLYDTNILIDHLSGVEQALREVRRNGESAISVVTWMEVMAGAGSEEDAVRSYLRGYQRIELDDQIVELAVLQRRHGRLRLPDAIILATARARGLLLITRNTKDFPEDDPGVRVPYRL